MAKKNKWVKKFNKLDSFEKVLLMIGLIVIVFVCWIKFT